MSKKLSALKKNISKKKNPDEIYSECVFSHSAHKHDSIKSPPLSPFHDFTCHTNIFLLCTVLGAFKYSIVPERILKSTPCEGIIVTKAEHDDE